MTGQPTTGWDVYESIGHHGKSTSTTGNKLKVFFQYSFVFFGVDDMHVVGV